MYDIFPIISPISIRRFLRVIVTKQRVPIGAIVKFSFFGLEKIREGPAKTKTCPLI